MKPTHPNIQTVDLKAKQTNEPARQLVDNADLSWTWSVLRAVFVLKARPSWVKLKRHEWKRLRGFTVRGLFNQTNKQTNRHPSIDDQGVLLPSSYHAIPSVYTTQSISVYPLAKMGEDLQSVDGPQASKHTRIQGPCNQPFPA